MRAAPVRLGAQRFGEAGAVGARAVDEDVVDAREQLDVDVDVVEQERVEHLAEQERRPGRAGRALVPGLAHDRAPAPRASCRSRRCASRRGAARGRWACSGAGRRRGTARRRCAPAGKQRDRRAGERVVRADAVGAEERARRGRRGDRRGRATVCMNTTVRPVETSVHETVSARSTCLPQAARHRAPADLALHELGHRPHVEEPVALAARRAARAAA